MFDVVKSYSKITGLKILPANLFLLAKISTKTARKPEKLAISKKLSLTVVLKNGHCRCPLDLLQNVVARELCPQLGRAFFRGPQGF